MINIWPVSAYRHLGKDEYRLLHLAPGTRNEEVVCWFEIVNIPLQWPPETNVDSYPITKLGKWKFPSYNHRKQPVQCPSKSMPPE